MSEQALREHVLYLLGGGGAHLDYKQAFEGLREELRGDKVAGIPHTPWRILEHMRICQWDILEFSRNPQHISPDFPQGYWPAEDAPASADAWDQSLRTFEEELQQMMDLVADPATDLYQPIPHGDGQTILREALLLADHNAYHLGQLVLLRRFLGDWQD
ncbi:MAG: DinB family protein [bacterium]|nr:DinB family protein [bacterium]